MKRAASSLLGLFVFTSVWMAPPPAAEAIPNSFFGNGGFIVTPAHPRFGANLTGDFLNLANWDKGQFPGPWKTTTTAADFGLSQMTALPVLFGSVPDSVVAREENGRLSEIVITYLDAGSFFPYQAGGEKGHEQRQTGSDRRSEFDSLWHRIDRDLRERLEAGCGPGAQTVAGRSDLLRTVYVDFTWEAFRLRLARREGHSVALHLSRAADPAPEPVIDSIAALDGQSRSDRLSERVLTSNRGEAIIDGIPVFDQGFTPYCGVHALAMVSHYHGLRLLPGALAAGAEFANTGSARGSRTLDLYRAVAEELDLKFANSSRFDARRVEQAIRSGLPVVVWRRVSLEREKDHANFAARLTQKPDLALASFGSKEKAMLPDRKKKGTPSHASVICGIDADEGVIVYLEPWGEDSLPRRMRIEEMEATAYAVFYFEP